MAMLAHSCPLLHSGSAPGSPSQLHCPSLLLLPCQVSELSLSGNQLKSDALQRLRFKAGKELKPEKEGEDTGSEEGGAAAEQGRTVGSHEGESVDASSPSAAKAAATKARELAALRARAQVVDCRGGCRSNAQLVTLHPMEVRTFEFIWG